MTVVALHRPERTDAELLERVAAGDLGSLGALFDRYSEDLRRFMERLGASEAEVDDFVQMTFLDILRVASVFDGRSSARNWFFGIATMVVRRHRRSVARVARGLVAWANEPAPPCETPGQRFERHEEAARAARALDRLSSKKREVFVMVVLEGLSGEEAARALGIPVATVWTRLHHARRELRAHLEREGP